MSHVLVVDDDGAVREMISEALRDRNLCVDCSATDAEAYRRLSALPSSAALVIDVNLGLGTTGYDVARYARRLNPDIAVVYISGAVTDASARHFGVPGSAFIAKPFTGTEVADVVLRNLPAGDGGAGGYAG